MSATSEPRTLISNTKYDFSDFRNQLIKDLKGAYLPNGRTFKLQRFSAMIFSGHLSFTPTLC